MESLVDSLVKLSPEESEAWILQMAQHAPPPGAKPASSPAPSLTDQALQAATVAPMDFGKLMNPSTVPPTAAGVSAPTQAYTAPQSMSALTPEQLRSLSAQGERTPVPKMPIPSAPGVHSPGQVSVTPSSVAAGQRSPSAPRLSLAQLLGR